MGLKAAIQALKKAEPLKDKVQHCKDLLNDNDAWICQQQLQKIYQQVLILDLEYALDKKVEQELWNLGFKNYIATLQSQAKDKKNPKRMESQALLGWCLEAASGFYLTLLQEICTAFDLDLPFRRKGYVYGCTTPWKAVEKLSAPHKSSCFYACQYCLVHLGDIARYRNENKQAELFYRHAVSLSPSSGQPYNQLALLEASRGDKLGTVFHYARSVAVKHPFPVATTNLAKTLTSALNDNSFLFDNKTKLTSQEYISVFLKLHGIFYNMGNLKVASSYIKLLTETLTALVATESFNSWRLVQMLVINLYALHHIAGATIDTTELLTNSQLSCDEEMARSCILDLIAGSLSALLLPVYTIKNSIVKYFALPSIKLCLDWIHMKPAILEESAFSSRLQIWPSLCVLLNALQKHVVDFKYDQYAEVPLPEDRDLQGFLPLQKAFESLRFTNTGLDDDTALLDKLRAARILHLGRCFAQYQINGSMLICINENENGEMIFTSQTESSGLSNELMKELEELSLNKKRQPVIPPSPVPSESSKGSAETDAIDLNLEKKIGILKPQGSLERNRDILISNRESLDGEQNTTQFVRKPRQNVAMQAIMRRAETEQKQVTFRNISPLANDETNDKNVTVIPSSVVKSVVDKNDLSIVNDESNHNLQDINNRSPSMPFPISVMAIQKPTKGSFDSAKLTKTQQNISQISQINPIHSNVQTMNVTQFGDFNETSTSASTNYQSQNFNVQNPQFAKHIMLRQLINIPQYQMQPTYDNTSHKTSTNNMAVPSNVITERILPMPIPQNSLQSTLMQNVSLIPPTHQVHIRANTAQGTQPIVNLPIQQNNISINNQVNMNNSNVMNNLPTMTNLAAYQKNICKSDSIGNIQNVSLSTTNLSNFNLNFNQSVNKSAPSCMPENQLSTIYNKNSPEYCYSNSVNNIGNAQHQLGNNYTARRAYETNFSLWNDQQQLQPTVAWWNTSESTQTGSDNSANTFKNWDSSSNRIPPSLGNISQNTLHSKQFNAENGFNNSSPFTEQKPTESPNMTNTYSLFSGDTWVIGSHGSNSSSQENIKTRLNQQSLWSGPGPSPLERLLEQQKSLREGGT